MAYERPNILNDEAAAARGVVSDVNRWETFVFLQVQNNTCPLHTLTAVASGGATPFARIGHLRRSFASRTQQPARPRPRPCPVRRVYDFVPAAEGPDKRRTKVFPPSLLPAHRPWASRSILLGHPVSTSTTPL